MAFQWGFVISVTKSLLFPSILPFNTASKVETFFRSMLFCHVSDIFSHTQQERNRYKILCPSGYLELNFWLFLSLNLYILDKKAQSLKWWNLRSEPHTANSGLRPLRGCQCLHEPIQLSRATDSPLQVLTLSVPSSPWCWNCDEATKVNMGS